MKNVEKGLKSTEKRQFWGIPQGVDQLLHFDQLWGVDKNTFCLVHFQMFFVNFSGEITEKGLKWTKKNVENGWKK